jgi:hypothetical protein
MVASVSSGGIPRVDPPRALFTLPGEERDHLLHSYDVAPDGRILVVHRARPAERSRAILVENWFDEVSRLAPR